MAITKISKSCHIFTSFSASNSKLLLKNYKHMKIIISPHMKSVNIIHSILEIDCQ